MSSGAADSATLARQWIETHAALFAVLVIAAVLLLVAVITLLVYCCCCRRKQSRWGGGGSKSTGSHLHVELHGDSVDASSAVTATIRGPSVLEIHLEKEHQNRSQLEQPVSVTMPEIVVSYEETARLEDVHFQQSSDSDLRAEFPPLPKLPSGVEVTSNAELRLHNRSLPEVKADITAAASASIAASASGSISASAADDSPEQERPMRLPRTEVVLQTEIMQQHQQPLRSSPPKAAVVVVPAKAKSPEAVAVRHVGDGRPSHEHRHGSSIYQSDDNEITIVDSDFSDYEDTPEDEVRKKAKKSKSQLGVGLADYVNLDVEASADFGWETLPNKPVAVEEPPIRAVDRQGEEYIPAPSPSLEEQQMRRAENLAELDRTLDVFEVEADVESGGGGDFGFDFSVGGGTEVGADVDLVDEEAILPLDRSQVPH